MQRIEDKSEGAWRPSPGSVYPSLQLLEDEGLVRSSERDGKRTYEITDAGRAEAERRVEEAGAAPWAQGERGGSYGKLFSLLRQVALAARQVAKVGTPAQVEQAATIMEDARKRLYQLLIAE
jgi:DNA-binding PadR family transcriptional regulator